MNDAYTVLVVKAETNGLSDLVLGYIPHGTYIRIGDDVSVESLRGQIVMAARMKSKADIEEIEKVAGRELIKFTAIYQREEVEWNEQTV